MRIVDEIIPKRIVDDVFWVTDKNELFDFRSRFTSLGIMATDE